MAQGSISLGPQEARIIVKVAGRKNKALEYMATVSFISRATRAGEGRAWIWKGAGGRDALALPREPGITTELRPNRRARKIHLDQQPLGLLVGPVALRLGVSSFPGSPS